MESDIVGRKENQILNEQKKKMLIKLSLALAGAFIITLSEYYNVTVSERVSGFIREVWNG